MINAIFGFALDGVFVVAVRMNMNMGMLLSSLSFFGLTGTFIVVPDSVKEENANRHRV